MKQTKISQQTQKATGAAIATSVLAAALMTAVPNMALAGDKERCADVVKGGKNSCAVKSLGISCQGNAKEDNMPGAWIKVPSGTCANIVSICDGSASAPEGVDEGKMEKVCTKIAPQEEGVVGGRLVDKYGESI